MRHVIHVPTIHFNLSPHGFRRWARHFLACRLSFSSPDKGFSPVPYFLDCRAIELELKARHLESVNQAYVKDRFGHNIERAYQNLPRPEQTLSPGEFRTLQAASNIYKNKGFEYFSLDHALSGFSKVPELAALDAVTIKLVPK